MLGATGSAHAARAKASSRRMSSQWTTATTASCEKDFLEPDRLSPWRSWHAIHGMENLIAYLEANPYSNSHKAAVITSAHKTIQELRAAMVTPWCR
jgi:hypothetical protein